MTPYTGPTKDDFLTQIDADLEADGGESDEVLKERRSRVEAATTDKQAFDAYHGHTAELREEAAAAEETEAPDVAA